jgi:hypothetical protein
MKPGIERSLKAHIMRFRFPGCGSFPALSRQGGNLIADVWIAAQELPEVAPLRVANLL